MSLINDALKKAARQRAQEQADVTPPMPGGGRSHGARRPAGNQTIILIVVAAIALIAISAVVTGILISGKPSDKPAAQARTAPVPLPAQQVPVAAEVKAPVIVVAVPTAAPALPSPEPVALAKAAPSQAPAAVPAPPAASAASHNDMVQAAVDKLHVSGVRASGSDSKALVDGRVYRVNDIIDRAIGLRLVKVDEDHLTLVDREGTVFVKNF